MRSISNNGSLLFTSFSLISGSAFPQSCQTHPRLCGFQRLCLSEILVSMNCCSFAPKLFFAMSCFLMLVLAFRLFLRFIIDCLQEVDEAAISS